MDERYYDRERGGRGYDDDRYRGEGRRGERRGEERGFFERAGDEVRTWFGDDDAQRRRIEDERRYGEQSWSRQPTEWERRTPQGARSHESARGWERPESHGSPRHGEERSWGGYGGGSSGSQEFGGYGRQYGGERYAGSGSSWGQGGQYGQGGQGTQGSQFGRETERWSQQGGWGSHSGIGQPGASQESQYGSGSQYGGQSGRGEWEQQRSPVYSYSEFWLISGPHSGRGPKGYQRSDDRIKEELCERLSQHGQLDASDLEVKVQNGEVTLSGSVRERHAKRTAEDVAESVSGVREVHNQVRVDAKFGSGQGQQSGQYGSSGQSSQFGSSQAGQHSGSSQSGQQHGSQGSQQGTQQGDEKSRGRAA